MIARIASNGVRSILLVVRLSIRADWTIACHPTLIYLPQGPHPRIHSAARCQRQETYPCPDLPESDGTFSWNHTTLVLVTVRAASFEGVGYTYADVPVAELIKRTLVPLIEGKNVFDIRNCWESMRAAIRNLGRPGMCSMAIAVMDSALSGPQGQAIGRTGSLPCWAVRSPACKPTAAAASPRTQFRSYKSNFAGWVEEGMKAVKMKIGTHPELDTKRVRAARDAMGSPGQEACT